MPPSEPLSAGEPLDAPSAGEPLDPASEPLDVPSEPLDPAGAGEPLDAPSAGEPLDVPSELGDPASASQPLDGGQPEPAKSAAVQAVIFDLDGTLVDHEGAVRGGLHDWLPTFSDAIDEMDLVPGFRRQSEHFERLTQLWLQLEDKHLPAWRSGAISLTEQRRRRLRDFLPAAGIHAQPDELDGLFADYLRRYEAHWRPFPDARKCLQRLRKAGVILAVLTNGTQAQQTAKVQATGLAQLCGPVFASAGIGVAKPDHASYLLVCQRLGVKPAHTLMVGDSYELDVRAAREAGLRAVHLNRAQIAYRVPDRHRIATLADLVIDQADVGTVSG